ncbi:MAG: zinc ribbon domain-containing protein [Bryobacteraceae bacterium]
MSAKNESSTRFMDEVRIISPWTYFVAFLIFALVMAAVAFAALSDPNGSFYSLIVWAPLGLVAGTAMACYTLLLGYISRDAACRGMSRLAWTLVALLVPYALGIVLYFVLRKPRLQNCPQCNTAIEPAFGFCPSCRYRLTPACPHCQRGVQAGDKFCPFCGGQLEVPVP